MRKQSPDQNKPVVKVTLTESGFAYEIESSDGSYHEIVGDDGCVGDFVWDLYEAAGKSVFLAQFDLREVSR